MEKGESMKLPVYWGLYEEDNGDYSLYEYNSGKTLTIPEQYQKKIKRLKKQKEESQKKSFLIENKLLYIIGELTNEKTN
jgi:hypothetical protein